MKLLFDANLSRSLVTRLADVFPGSLHSSVLSPDPTDEAIWAYAKANGFAIVSKDSDFYRMSVSWGVPPKVVWLRIGNGSTSLAERVIRSRARDIETFAAEAEAALLIVESD